MDGYISRIGSQILDFSVTLTVRHAGYLLLSDGYMKDLQGGVNKIKATREGIQHRIDEAELTDEYKIEPVVLSWMVEAESYIDEAEELIASRKNATRCVGLVANPKTRYQLGRKAKHTFDDIASHLKDKEFDRISYRPVSSDVTGTASSSKGGLVALKSRNSMLEKIIKALGDDTVDMIGVYGDGGVGKTTLLNQVEREARASKDFDEVVTGVVSQNPDLNKMRAKIQNVLERVKLKAKKDEEDNDNKVGLSGDNEGKANVKKRGVLIILDDLWKKIELEEIGVGKKEEKIKVKLLMTSRYGRVLVDEMESRENFHLKVLNEKEAWDLFESIVGNKVTDPSLKSTAEELVKKCQGLPLLIDALGKQLEKTNSPKDWEGVLEQLQGSDIVHKALELSFKHLEDRHLMLLRIISGLDRRGGVREEALVRYVVGLGLFARNINTVQAARDGTMSLLNGLRADSLLLDCEDNCVKVHDLVRDAVISIADRDQHALVLRDEKDLKDLEMKLPESKAIFLPYPDISRLPAEWKCPELEILVAFMEKDHLLPIPDSSFQFMPKLKVFGLSHASAMALPPSIPCLENLQTLCLHNCDLEDVRIVGELRNLQALSFIGSDITLLPKEVGQLTELRLLDLSHCCKLEMIERGALEGLIQLEELAMENSFVQWDAGSGGHENNVSLAELDKMAQLSNLDILVPHVNMLCKDLPFGKLIKYRIHIGDTWDWSGEYKWSRTLKLSLQCSWILSEEWFQLTLQSTEHLHLCHWNGRSGSVHELCRKGFKELKHLRVEKSPAAYYVVRSSEWLAESAFTVLESLFLEDLVNLERICHGLLRKDSFTRLREVTVHRCNKLKNLFGMSVVRGLCDLEKIEVIDCDMVEEVIIAERAEEDEDEDEDENRVDDGETTTYGILGKLPLVQGLVSANRLTSCCFTSEKAPEDEPGEDDGDKIVEGTTTRCCIVGMPAPKQPRCTRKKVAEDDDINLPRLRHLTLERLPSITNFFSKAYSILSDSPRQAQGNQAAFFDGRRVSLPYLESLKLIMLPKLIEMWQIHPSLALSKLQSLEVSQCKNLSKAIDSTLVRKLENLESLSISDCESIREVFDLQGLEVAGGDAEILSQLRTLELRNLDLRDVWTKSPKGITGFRNLMSIKVDFCKNLRYLFTWSMAKAMENLTEIDVSWCDKMEAVVVLEEGGKAEDVLEFPSLKVLNIELCPEMKCFYLNSNHREAGDREAAASLQKKKQEEDMPSSSPDEGASDTTPFFNEKVLLPSLEKLQLCDLWEVKKIWHNKLPKKSFCKLESLAIKTCQDLSSVFPPTLARRLNMLKKIKFFGCRSLEMLLEPNLLESAGKLKRVSLSQLKEVELEMLPKLKHVVASDSNTVVGLPSLTKIEVSKCAELIYIFPNATATSLSKLEEVSISSCTRMTGVISKDEGEGIQINEMDFPCLRLLKLSNLPNVICFCYGSCSFSFPSLANISITGCPIMESFVPMSKHMEPQAFFNEKVELPNLVQLTIEENGLEELWHVNVPTRSFWKLKDLRVIECARLRRIIPFFMDKRLLSLEVLKIISCPSVEEIYELNELNVEDGSNSSEKTTHLTELILLNLPNLTSIWNNDSLSTFFVRNLTLVEISSCDSLTSLFTTSQAKWLEQLQQLIVDECGSMEHIIVQGNCKETAEGVIFPRLTSLQLSGLPMLSSFYKRHTSEPSSSDTLFSAEKISFPCLEKLEISRMDKLREIWHGQVSRDSFRNITVIKVKYCHELVTIFAPESVHAFHNLEELKIANCGSLTVIFDMEGLSTNINSDLAPGATTWQLKELTLDSLYKLEHIWSRDPKGILSFQNLHSVSVLECQRLRYLFSTSVAKALVQLDKLEVQSSGLESIVAADEDEEDEKAGRREIVFHRLSHLELSQLPEMKSFYPGPHISEWPCLEKLKVENCNGIETLFGSASCISQQPFFLVDKVTFPRLVNMEIKEMGKMRMVWDSRVVVDDLGELKQIKVEDCPELLTLFPSTMVLKNLEKLKISGCESLRHLCNRREQRVIAIFQKLNSLEVFDCLRLEYLFPASTAKSLFQLEYLSVSRAGIKVVIAGEDKVEAAGTTRFAFPRVSCLQLLYLPHLESFYPQKHVSQWPLLKEMEIKECGSVKSFAFDSRTSRGVFEKDLPAEQPLFWADQYIFPSLETLSICGDDTTERTYIWKRNLKLKNSLVPSSVSFLNLSSLIIYKFHGFKTLFTSPTAKSLVQLREMTIQECDALTEVVAGDDSNGGDEISFDRLKNLGLDNLISITQFCSKDYALKFPSLENLLVRGCPLMAVFSKGDLRAPKLDKVWRDHNEDNRVWDSDLNGTIRRIYNNKEGLERLKLSASPEWKEAWLNHHPPRFFTELRELTVEDCEFLSTAVIPSDKLPILMNLELLVISDCRAVERVFDSPKDTEDGHGSIFSGLRTIYLSNMPILTLVIPDNLLRVVDFCLLSTIEIDNCGTLRTILSPTTALGLPSLEKIKISNCEMLEEVIAGENEADQTRMPIRFEWLRSITLESLPELVGFCPSSHFLDCLRLEDITVRDCPKMETFTSRLLMKEEEDRNRATSSKLINGDVQVHNEPFFNEKVVFPRVKALALSHMNNLSIIWHDRLAENSFSKLTEMKIEHCAKLLKVFPPESIQKRLALLQTLSISHCDSLEEVFDVPEIGVTGEGGSRGPEQGGDRGEIREEEVESKDGVTTLSLRELTLSHLPELKSICKIEIEGIMSFKDLEPVRVIECPKLESFGGFSFVTE